MIRRIRASGSLSTDPSALDQPESLLVAQNVTMHRPGIIQPRPGFGDTTGLITRSFASFTINPIDDGSTVTVVVAISQFGAYVPQVGWTLTDEVPNARTITNVVTGATQYTITVNAALNTADEITVSAGATNYKPISMVAFGGDVVVQSGGAIYRIERASTMTVYTSTDANATPPVGRGVSAWMKARSSLYYTTNAAGIRKIRAISSTSDERAGLPTTYMVPASTTVSAAAAASDTAAIESGSSVGYRYVFRRDSNYTLRSAPSARWIIPADAGTYPNGAYHSPGLVHLPDEIVAGDFLELYRTVNSGSATADPGEDFYLTATYEIASTDVSNGYTPAPTWIDQTLDDLLGAALYTSASQFGISAAKEIPPLAEHLTLWNRCAWAGNTRVRAVLPVTITKVAYESGATVRLEGTGLCTVRSGSYAGVAGNSLTGVTFAAGLDWAALVAGAVMWISDSDDPTATAGRIPANSRIVSFNSGAGTITLDNAPLGAGTFRAGDIVTIEQDGADTEFFATNTTDYTTRRFVIPLTTTDAADRTELTAGSLARVISQWTAAGLGTLHVYAINDQESLNLNNGTGGDGAMLLVADRPENTNFSVRCEARPTAFADMSADGVISGAFDDVPGRVQWSDPDEPESWPLGNTVIIGDKNADVLGFAALERALIVFKEDGIYAVTGYPPNAWTVREIDLGKRLLASQSICVLDDTCYAWTNRGIVAVNETGARIVSNTIGDALRDLQSVLPLDENSTHQGFWMQSHPRYGYVLLGVGNSASSTTAVTEFVFWPSVGRWASWNKALRCMAYDDAEDRMVVAPTLDAAWVLAYERSAETTSLSYRDSSAVSLAATISGTSVTIAIAQFGPYTPSAANGDVLVDASLVAKRITAVNTVSTDYVITVDSTGLSGTKVDWHQGYPISLQWADQHLPGVGTRWQEIHLHLQDANTAYVGSWPMSVGGVAYASGVMASESVAATVSAAGVVRVGPPRNIVRCARLRPTLTAATAGVLWQLNELALHNNAQSRRVSR